jgi:Tfp pilus assembly protein PilN
MIKINFLQQEAVQAVANEPTSAVLAPARQTAIFLASLLVASALTGSFYWFWNRQLNRLSQDLAAEQREAARLSSIQTENQRFQQRVSEAERRLDTVRSLQSQRVGPVALMNALGELVNRTTGLYLLTVNAEGGRLQIQGQSDSVEAIVNFIGVLRHSGGFADVQFHQFFQDNQEKRLSFKFNLDCVYQPTATPSTMRAGSGVLQTAATTPAGNAPATLVR